MIITSFLLFLAAYFIWKKQKLSLLAGYIEDSIKPEDKQRYARVNGIMFILYGGAVFIYSFIFTKVSVFLPLCLLIGLCFIHVAAVAVLFRERE